MDGESKVHHRCACRHLAQLALRREHHNFVRKEVELDRVEEVERVGLRVVEDFFDRVEPLVQFVLVVSGVLVLIFPVCGKTLLGDVVHAVGADLHLNPLPVLAHKRVVERLIAVGLGVGHPVAEARGVRLVDIGQCGIDIETFAALHGSVFGREDDADGQEVEDFVEGHVLVLHLHPNGVGTFDAFLYRVARAHLVERGANGRGELGNDVVEFHL